MVDEALEIDPGDDPKEMQLGIDDRVEALRSLGRVHA